MPGAIRRARDTEQDIGPYAVGTLVAAANDSNGNPEYNIAYWSDMYEEKLIFGSGPVVGT